METERPLQDLSLLDCCRYLADHNGWTGFSDSLDAKDDLPADQDGERGLERIIQMANIYGLKTVIYHQSPKQLAQLASKLPIIVEMVDGSYQIIGEIEDEGKSEPASVTILKPGESPGDTIISADFQNLWTGAVLFFEKINTALACFSVVAGEHKVELTQERLQHEYGLSKDEITQNTLLRMGKDFGMKGKLMKMEWEGLINLNKAYPAILKLGNGTHVVATGVVSSSDGSNDVSIGIWNPIASEKEQFTNMTRSEIAELWDGDIYIFKKKYKLSDENQPFSLRWFMPEILRQKITFFDIGLAVLFINAIALITPLFFQIVIDKVLVNQAFTTLHVLGIGMTVMLIVNGCLDYLRDYLLLNATNKIDLRVTARTFRHMLNLPLDFFEKMTAGVLTKHMQQTSNIRGFLTGSVFLTFLEATSLFIFLPFLFFYSFKLTVIVLVFTLLIATVIFLLMSPFKRRLDELYEAEGKRQAMLVETINGMSTVKAMAIEPLLRNRWENKVAQAISMQFRVGKISITAKSITQLLERLMIVLLIWLGASQVFSGVITVGALIAFQMLASRVTSPLVRLVGLIHQYQEAALSVEKLGTVMNAKTEWGADRHGTRPSLLGDIVFDRVSFRYGVGLSEALKDISFTIPAGSTLGIVGPSGSGKTTLTRLLQKAYFPTNGTIRINDCYMGEIDTAHLRRNTGVVLQENFLFRTSVAENIRSGQTGASRQEIINAAILAGADEFIVEMIHGYDTLLEEGATNMSGGQRQRLAIARALLTHPQILILDEATSSLDPESERIVRNNLAKIGQDRTVIIVSHRLSMLKDADSIIVLEDGKLVEHGNHQYLLDHCLLYKNLWEQQMELV